MPKEPIHKKKLTISKARVVICGAHIHANAPITCMDIHFYCLTSMRNERHILSNKTYSMHYKEVNIAMDAKEP